MNEENGKRMARQIPLRALLPLAAVIPLFLAFAPFPATAQQKAIEVIAAPVKNQEFSDGVEALGTTKANESVVITAETAGKITAIHFQDGQEVKKGDLLLTLEQSEEQAELRSAEAALAEAKSSYDRANDLQTNSALSKGTLQERLMDLRQSEAAIEEIKARIEKRNIVAPFDGVLGLREVSVGSLIQPGDTITTIDDLSQVKIDFDVPSVFLGSLQPGMPITGKIEAFGDHVFTGEVRTVNTQVDPVTRTVRVRAVIPNTDGMLKPGLLMAITLMKNQRQALVVPEESLIKRGEDNFVYIIVQQGGQTSVHEQKVKIGGRQPGIIEILSGLRAGDMLVVHGTVKMRDGMAVSVRAVEQNDAPLEELLTQNPAAGQIPATKEE